MASSLNPGKTVLLLCLIVTALFATPAYSDQLSDSNRIFNWAEKNYPDFFSSSSSGTNETLISSGYIFRYYDKTETYIATYEKKLYLYGNIFGGLLDLGSVNSFLALLECNEFKLDPAEPYTEVAVGVSVNFVHHKYVSGYTVAGHFSTTDISGNSSERAFSVTFRCNKTHRTTVEGSNAVEGSFVADYDTKGDPVIFLYNSAGGEKHILSLSNMSIDLAVSRFDSNGVIDSITRTTDCGDSINITPIDDITCDDSEYPGYLFCRYSFAVTNTPNLGRWQQESFFHYMKNAGELTEEINRNGAHVDLTDGAEELKVFQRGDDSSLSKTDINNECTLTVEKDEESQTELKYRRDVPDNEARDMLMTYLPADDEAPENFRVHLKTGKGIAPSTIYTLICDKPENCCYGNHCLNQYDRAGNDWGQYLGTRIYFGFYAPIAGSTCRTEPEEKNSLMTTIDVDFEPPVTDDNPGEGEENGGENPGEAGKWSFSVDYSSYYGSGRMQIDNFDVDTNCNEAVESFCIFVNDNNGVSYSGELSYDSNLAPLLVYREDGKITMDWSAIVTPSWGEGFSAQIGGSPYGDYLIGICNGDLPIGALEKFKNGEAFSWTSTTTQGSETCTCKYSFKLVEE